MVSILVIQFRSEPAALASEQYSLQRTLSGCDCTFKNALADEVAWQAPEKEVQEFDAVVLAGSGELFFDGGYAETHEGRVKTTQVVEVARPFAEYLLRFDKSTLGICFGHQLLGYAAGVDVGYSRVESKTGTHTVSMTEEGREDPIFDNIPETFLVQYSHRDVLFDLPKGATVLATCEEKCKFAALRYSPHVYSVQFHPERTREQIIESSKRYAEYVPDGMTPEELFTHDSKESERILSNFVDIVTRVK